MTATSLPSDATDVPLILYERLLAYSENYTNAGNELRLMGMFEFFPLDKVNSIPKDATAFPSRGSGCNIMLQGIFDGSGTENELRAKEKEAREVVSSLKKLIVESGHGDMAPYGNYGTRFSDMHFLTFIDSCSTETEEKPPVSRSEVVFKHNYARLREIKAKYDPEQIFSRWFGIEPAKSN